MNPNVLILSTDGADGWLQLQDAAQNSVVQIVAQVAKFNWVEPYKVAMQGESRGTGFFIDDQGHIITNAHVIEEATRVWIHMPSLGRRAIFVDIVSICPDRDLALLRVQPQDLEILRSAIGGIVPLVLGDSDLIKRTEQVLVLGYPLGQPRMKSSTGVISGRESIMGRSFIQITAPINPGNSGGPLFNLRGEVIGIAIAVVFLSQNVGYTIPINELKIVLEDLYTKPFIRRQTLGSQFNFATDELAQYLHNPEPAGLYVNSVLKGSLLDQAGVREGDMIYEFNGFRLDGFGDTAAPWTYDKIGISDLVARLVIGSSVQLVVYRNGNRLDINFTFNDTPSLPVRYRYPGYEPIEYEIIGGMTVMQLSDNHLLSLLNYSPYLIRYTQLEQKLKPRLVISHIVPGSLTQQGRSLMPGFIIKQINGIDVGTIEEFRNAVRQSIKSQFLTVKTDENIFCVLPFMQALRDELQLSKDYAYPISPFIQELIEGLS